MLVFENVSKTYKTGTNALHDVSFTIGDGEFVYIIGPTGAGKSTLLKLLTSEEVPTKGTVKLNDINVGKLKQRQVPGYRQKLGIVFQEYRLLPKKNVFDNVIFAMEVLGADTTKARHRTREVLTLVGLDDKHRSFPNQLSGGQQQRVAIARAIANSPKILICDEPTGDLDPSMKEEIVKILERINREEGTTIIMVTHDERIVNEHKKRTIVINEGHLVADLSNGGYNSVQKI